ncbi:hypothetical protein JCM10207_000418 [Rhodosporidiobolus poonsookiae]
MLARSSAAGSSELWVDKYGASPDLSFTGIVTFAHLPHYRCLEDSRDEANFDIAILGQPFDTSVSFRPGARFGPNAIRQGSRRHATNRAYSIPWNFNPYEQGTVLVDCGDVPVSPYDNSLALDQLETAYSTLLARPTKSGSGGTGAFAKDGREHPRIISLGGDHTIVLPILRSLHKVYGPVTVIHFDAHLDTWNGALYRGAITPQSQITHGSFFYKAYEEGLVSRRSVHAGIRTRLSGFDDLLDDDKAGFQILSTDDLEEMGTKGIIAAIKKRVGDSPVYLSFDIDTIDPSMAPATGTPEPGGWTTREVKSLLRGLSSLNLVGADIVEVSPAYDTNAELTAMVAADLVQEFVAMMIKKEERWAPAVKGGVLNDPRAEGKKAAHEEL